MFHMIAIIRKMSVRSHQSEVRIQQSCRAKKARIEQKPFFLKGPFPLTRYSPELVEGATAAKRVDRESAPSLICYTIRVWKA